MLGAFLHVGGHWGNASFETVSDDYYALRSQNTAPVVQQLTQ